MELLYELSEILYENHFAEEQQSILCGNRGK